jgi:hypothetical protein
MHKKRKKKEQKRQNELAPPRLVTDLLITEIYERRKQPRDEGILAVDGD